MGIEFNDEQLNAVISGALMQMLTPDTRERLLKEAIAGLMSKPKKVNSWDTGESPIQEAFKQATQTMAQNIVREKLETDETFKKIVNELIEAAVQKSLVQDREKVVNNMAMALTVWMERDR